MTRTRWNTELVSEEMIKEDCILLDEYKRGDIRIRYEYHEKHRPCCCVGVSAH